MEDIQSYLESYPLHMWTLYGIFTACYLEWGLVNVLQGASLLYTSFAGNEFSGEYFNEIYDASESDYTDFLYPAHTNNLLIQHGFNVLFYGFWALFAVYVAYAKSDETPLFAMLPFMGQMAQMFGLDVGGNSGPFT